MKWFYKQKRNARIKNLNQIELKWLKIQHESYPATHNDATYFYIA